ncbi:hypothetical protein ACET3Z_011238 [Daucus carota]
MQPPNPNPNYPPLNQTDPNALYYQQSHASNYSYYYPNHHLQPPNPNYSQHTFQSDSSIPSHDPYYNVSQGSSFVNPPGFDPNSYPPQSYGYDYQVQQPGGVDYQQYQAVSAEVVTAPYYSDPNAASMSTNWAVNDVTSAGNGVTLPPNGMHQYVPAKPKPVSLNRRAKLKVFSKKEPKTKVVQSAWCEVCRVSCDTKDVLDKHKSGKKHMKNLEKLGGGSVPSSYPVPVASAGPANPVIGPRENPDKKKATPSATKIVQSAWCEVCKVKCDTIDVLNVHNSGKKHKKNLEKLTRASVPVPGPVPLVASENPLVGPPVNPGKSASVGVGKSKKKAAGSSEDLETKRRRVLEGGAPVSTVRTCVTCNVVCNSETVFQYHIQGQKHMAMIVKLASERTKIAAGAIRS